MLEAWLIPVLPSPPQKKQTEKDKGKAKAAKSLPVVATHQVQYVDALGEMSWGDMLVYQMPVLVEISESKQVHHDALNWAAIPFDTEELARPAQRGAKVQSFASR